VTTGVSDTATVVVTVTTGVSDTATVVVTATKVEPSRLALSVAYPALDDVTVTVADPLAGNPVTTPSPPVSETDPDVVVAANV
jgi:hypothetical protein